MAPEPGLRSVAWGRRTTARQRLRLRGLPRNARHAWWGLVVLGLLALVWAATFVTLLALHPPIGWFGLHAAVAMVLMPVFERCVGSG